MRVIDETDKQLGVFPLPEALQLAQARNLDLIQVTDKAQPPVCKIMDYGKYLYWLQKKEKEMKKHSGGEVKGIRLTFGISPHDLEVRAKAAEKFLKEGNKIRIEMVLRGREKAHGEIAKEKIGQFLEFLNKSIPIKVEKDLKRELKGFTMIIAKQ